MVLHQLPEKGIVLVQHQVVKSYTAADKNLFYPRKLPQLSQQAHIVGVVHHQVGTWFWEQALPVGTYTVFQLLLAGGLTEIGGGPAHIMDVALKVRLPGHPLRLRQDRSMTAGLNGPALVEGQRAEIAAAKTAAAGCQAELDL